MKTLTNILILVLSLTLISGCMPSSFTKWKQNAPTTKKATSVFEDSNGNPIPSGNLTFPSYLSYHVIPNPVAFPASTAATSDMNFTPKMNGDLSAGYPWGTNAQALAPLFTIEDLPVPYNCGGTVLGTKGAVSDISINSSSGVVTLSAAALNAATPETREYCLKLRYKSPTTTSPGYTYLYLYGVLKVKILTPLTTLDFKQSPHLILKLSSKVDLGQFTTNNSVLASPSGAQATIDYYNQEAGELYVTATTTTSSLSFRPSDKIRVAAGSIGAPYYDGTIGQVVNIYPRASIPAGVPNIISYPLASSSALAANGVTFSINPTVTPPFLTFDTITGTFTAILSDLSGNNVSYSYIATNDLGSVNIPFIYKVADGYAPPSKAGTLLYAQSSTLTIDISNVNGNFADFATATNLSSNGATGVVYSTQSDANSNRSITLTVTATGTQGFVPGKLVTAANGTTTALIKKVTNVFLVSNTDNILSHSGTSFAPYWSAGDQTSNGINYKIEMDGSSEGENYDPTYLGFSTTTGAIAGFSPKAVTLNLTTTATNSFGSANFTNYLSFVLKGNTPLGLTYVQKKAGTCKSRAKLTLGGISGSLATVFPLTKKIWANNPKESTSATLTYIDPANKYILVDIESGYFLTGQKIDSSTSTYTVPRATILKVVNVFDKNVALCAGQIVPIIEPAGEVVTYSMTPDFPSEALGLTFDSTSGSITGTPTDNADETDYVVAASNSSGKATANFSFQISTSPKALSYSRQVLLNVDTGSEFHDGSSISSKNPDASGVVRKKIDLADGTSNLLVDVINGLFTQNAAVDKYATYKDPRAQVLSVVANTFLVDGYGGPALSSADVGKYVYNTVATKQAVITAADSGYIFLRLVKGSFSAGEGFCVDADPALVSCLQTHTITRINAPSLSLTTAANPAFVVGDSILSSGGLNYTSLMITATSSAATKIDVATQSFVTPAVGDNLYIAYTGVLAPVAISGITHNHNLYMYQGEKVTITPNLMEGDNIVYSQTGSLPPGLSFDTTTGVISGTVANSTTSTGTAITITATNFMGSTSHTFMVKAFRHFEIAVKMTEAPSMITHREGRSNNVTPCRVTWEQAQATDVNGYDRNILCRVDAGEVDLFKEGVEFQIFAGKNMCEKVVYYPYYFWTRPVGKTDYQYAYKYDCACTNKITNGIYRGCDTANTGLQNGGVPGSFNMRAGVNYYDSLGNYITESSKLCAYNYTLANGSALKCDEGKVNIQSRKFVDDPLDTGFCSARTGALSCVSRTECEDANNTCSGGSATGTEGKWIPSCVQDSALADLNVKEYCEGKGYNCVEGGIKDLFQEPAFTSGIRGEIISTVNGYPDPGYKVYKIEAPINKGHGTNLRVANYTNVNSCQNGNYNYYANNWAAYSATITATTDPWGEAQPFYIFECLDAAGDTKAKIRVQVRDWNRAVDVFDDIDRIIPTSPKMDDRSVDTIMGGSYNQFSDWDDNFSNPGLPATSSLNNCSAGAPTPGVRYPFPASNL